MQLVRSTHSIHSNNDCASTIIECERSMDQTALFGDSHKRLARWKPVGNVWKKAVSNGGKPVDKKIDFATYFFFHLNRE
jgi:hypothetical protein